MDPFLSVVASAFPGREKKGRQSPKAAIPIWRNEERARQSYHRGRKSVFPSDNTHHPSYAIRSIQNLESCGDDKKRAFSCVALKKKKPKRRRSSLRFLPPAPPNYLSARPALEGKIRKARKYRGRGSSILFSSRELPDRRSIRSGLRVHFVGRNDPQSIRGFGEPKEVFRLDS
ncbi:hypothetical protein VNO80_06736 [Phaseolus coccineus]|uniref:Uncharacterized protein n=1 Tax=Phaseolus coccineus TaxID=3886 RepID=A0AAN9NMA5_PHACN